MNDLPTKPPQPLIVRLLHWAQVPLLVVLIASGLKLLVSYPFFGSRGRIFGGYPLRGVNVPDGFPFGDSLPAAQQLHFVSGFVLLAVGVVYAVWLAWTGEWRRRHFDVRRDAADSVATIGSYLRLRKRSREGQRYNGLQKLTYSVVMLVMVAEVLSGLVLFRPVHLRWLGNLMGGYEGVRAVHLYGMVILAAFTLVHLLMVLLHPTSLRDMITGGKPSRSAPTTGEATTAASRPDAPHPASSSSAL